MRTGDIIEVDGYRGVACRVVERDGDYVTYVMVGDDKRRRADINACQPLERGYCADCGQTGCSHAV